MSFRSKRAPSGASTSRARRARTGRVALPYDLEVPLAGPGYSFVIVRLTLDFRSEVTGPGRVDIGARVASIGRRSLTLEQGLFQDGACAATTTTVVVHVNGETRRSPPLRATAVQALT